MPDQRFFRRGNPVKLGKIAELTGAELAGTVNSDYLIEDVAPLDKAGPRDVSFLENVKYREDFLNTRAGACFVNSRFARIAPEGVALLVTEYPYKAYAHIAGVFYPDQRPDPYISGHCFIDETAAVGSECVIEHGAVIGPNVVIGDQCWIEPNSFVGRGVIIGDQCRIGANSGIQYALIGNNVRLYPGVNIGQDGFGFAIDPKGHIKVPQLGRVIIEDKCEIGAGTCIDRGAGPDTVIGEGAWIDNLVQIGHNVQIGKGCVIVAQAGIAGSSVLEDHVAVGGQVGISGHLRIGRGARIAGNSGVMRDVESGQEVMGYPAMPIKSFMRQVALLKKMIKKGG